MNDEDPDHKGFSTNLIHLGDEPEFPVGAVNTPIYASSTFAFPSVESGAKRFAGKEKGMIYSRWGNPTVQSLEKKLASLEKTESAIALSSGMNAITSLFLHFLSSGDEIVTHKTPYGGTFQVIARILPKYGIKPVMVDFKEYQEIETAITGKTKLLYFETPTNPLMEIIDITRIADIGQNNDILTVLDNTFAPPYLQQPIDLGVDLAVHSLTKYINGHSDIVGGAIVGPESLVEEIRRQTTFFLGGAMDPFSAFLVSRGVKTLKERLRKHCSSAQEIADFLARHPKVKKVYYPGLKEHEGHSIAVKQMRDGFGGMLSFVLEDGYAAGKGLMEKVKLPKLAVSLGGVESLIEHPASMTHFEYSREEREKAGIYDGLVRLSVGLEDVEDILADLEQALD